MNSPAAFTCAPALFSREVHEKALVDTLETSLLSHFFRPFPQIMQFNAIKLKIGVNSVGNGSGLALSEWPFLRSLPLV